MSTANRIIKNTGILYVKMGITMFISLYTTRLILASLGASDFGLFNVIAGSIAMLGFLNSTMANATQRFMSYAEGEGKLEKKCTIFNITLVLHFLIALITMFLLLAAMYPLFNGILTIEPSRKLAASIVYFCLIISTLAAIINVPYEAVMNAHENMLYYSIIGVLESFLKLAVALFCVYTEQDKLIVYGILMACIPLITLTVMKIYCHRNYEECVIAPRRYWNSSLVKQLSSFFGWNFLTAISSLLSAQGLGLVLNHFFGSILNAAQAIAHHVRGYLSVFSVNMMKALNPVIVKNAGAKDYSTMNTATLAGCKFSALLTMIFAIPISLEIDFVLKIWLDNPPQWAAIFVVFQLTECIIEQMVTSASTAVYAHGDIKYYAIWRSLTNISPLLLTWLAFSMGGSPIWLYVPMLVVWGICGDIVILYFAQKKCLLDIRRYIQEVFMPLLVTLLFMLLPGLFIMSFLSQGIPRFIVICIATFIGVIISAVFFLLSEEEKKLIHNSLSILCK